MLEFVRPFAIKSSCGIFCGRRQGGWCFTGWETRYVFIYQDHVFRVSLPTRMPLQLSCHNGVRSSVHPVIRRTMITFCIKRTKQTNTSALACCLNVTWIYTLPRVKESKTKKKAPQSTTAVLGGSDRFTRFTDAQTKASVRNHSASELWSVWLNEKQAACLLITWQVLSGFEM